MADSPSEDRDLVTFVVPRAHSRAVAEFLMSLGLVVGKAPSGVVPMAEHDTHLAVPDVDLTAQLVRIAERFPVAPSDGTAPPTFLAARALASLPEFTLDALGLYCVRCAHTGGSHGLAERGGSVIVCRVCECRTRHP